MLVLLVSAPLLAMTSLAQDVSYYRALKEWQQTSPLTYFAHSLLVCGLGIWLAVHRLRET